MNRTPRGALEAYEDLEYGSISAPQHPWLASLARGYDNLGRRLEGSPAGILYDQGLSDYGRKLAYGDQPNNWDRLSAGGALADIVPGVGTALGAAAALPARAVKTRAGRRYADWMAPEPGDVPLALPNPERTRTQNMMTRESAWQDLEKATKNAGEKRNKKTGRFVGGPASVLSPQKRTAVVNKYAQRTQDAIDAGIPPGYFYEQGSDALAAITDSPAEHLLMAQGYGPTSTQVGPQQNTNYAIRAMDQRAMGVPTNVTLYPNSLRPKMDSVMAGEDPWKGYKVDRYSHLLGPRDQPVNPLMNMPPNDQWEGFGTGFPQGTVPSGATQVAWSDDIRRRAADKMNTRRAAAGQKPLTPEEVQELHWAAIRAETEGRPLQLNPNDTLQGSLPQYRAQGTWEAEPGASAGITRLGSKEDYADEVYGVLADDQGKDRITRAMGGRLQDPIVRGTGVWEGELSPGFSSPSYASHTQARGMDPASAARLDSTEAVRQYVLGQEGRAHSLNAPARRSADVDIADVVTGAPPTPEETGRLQEVLGDAGVITPTAEGYRAVGFQPEGFTEAVANLSPDAQLGKNIGRYDTLDWAGGNATQGLLDALDASGMPGPGRLADSPQTRAIAGDMAGMYSRLEAEGSLQPNQKLTQALRVWQEQGLDGLRALVEKGLAPAVVLSLFAAGSDTQPSGEPSQS